MFGDQARVIASITFRATMGRKRALLFAIPPLILVLVTVLLKVAHTHDASWPSQIVGIFGFTVVLPLTALIIGTSVLGAEVDEGSIVHLLATPVPRLVVIWSKYIVAVLLTAAFVAVPELLAGLIATGGLTKLTVGLFVGALAGSVMYNAVFVMISVLTTRAIAYGLAYVVVWEGLVGNFVSGARLLSVGQYSLGVANAIAHDGTALNASQSLGTSVVMGAIVTVAAIVIAVRARKNILISGGTGAGKSTLLGVLAEAIPVTERIVTIEDTAELSLDQEHVVRMETRPVNIEGRGQITARDLLINALRMRPDRIIVGEVRGGEALEMLQAMNTGHDGGIGTIHANATRDALSRLETMVLMAGTELPSRAVREQIVSAIHLLVQVRRYDDGIRRIESVAEITGLEGSTPQTQELFGFRRRGKQGRKVIGHFTATGVIPRFVDELREEGVQIPSALFQRTEEAIL